MPNERFRTPEYRKHASSTFGRMSQTTLRVTGLEPVLERANAANKAVLKSLIGKMVTYEDIIKQCGNNLEGSEKSRRREKEWCGAHHRHVTRES